MRHLHEIIFTAEEMILFSKASHDLNPLHLSEEYARSTVFGQRVVFGVLGVLGCFKWIQDRPNQSIKKISIDFLQPIFMNVPYEIKVEEGQDQNVEIKLLDGNTLATKIFAEFKNESGQNIDLTAQEYAKTTTSMINDESLIKPGMAFNGEYRANQASLTGLIEHFKLSNKGISCLQLEALLWSSYCIGMEIPGRQALFSHLSLQFENPEIFAPCLTYRGEIEKHDLRFNLISLAGSLFLQDTPWAKVKLKSFYRKLIPHFSMTDLQQHDPNLPDLKGKTALLIGASRGLGAALCHILTQCGCTVLANYQSSESAAKELQDELKHHPGQMLLCQGDASSPDWCEKIKDSIEKDCGKLDILICNACPPLLPLWIEPKKITRVNQYVSQSLSLVSNPFAFFLGLLSESKGKVVVLSSAVLDNAVAEWPHYVAAKWAIEGLVESSALEYKPVSFLVVRPHRLLTELTNTPLGIQGALPTTDVASKIVKRMASSSLSGNNNVTRLIDWS